MLNGRQLTICWHADDLKISCFNINAVSNTITWLKSICGEMHDSLGNNHDYLGMWLDLSSKVEVKVSMEDYLKKVIDKFLEDIKGMASTSATENMFKLRDYDTIKLLHRTQKIAFHHSVAQLLNDEMLFFVSCAVALSCHSLSL